MARMYSRKKGRSGSRRPKVKEAKWVSHKPAEIKDIIVKLANEGKSSAEIGSILRDKYGIPSVRMVTEKKISQIMKENKVASELPEDMLNLLKNAVKLRAHLEGNKHDRYSKRGLELTESKIRRLAKYYKSRDVLPGDWDYDPEKAKLLVK
ncbi:MAG: 30S ribosomal protein S15 [Candidatus Aenigmatarchaeota archaeon]|nr:MAG: 30S ribosomal protein S15 [Candidatus Aenigmarchaeota archaeon]